MIGTGTFGLTLAALAALSGANEGYLTMTLEVPVSCTGGLVPSVQRRDSGELQLGDIVQRCNVNSQTILFYNALSSEEPVTFLVDGKPIPTRGGMIVIGNSPAFTSRGVSLSVDTQGMSERDIEELLSSISITVSRV